MAVTVLWRALTASWRQKGKRKQVFPRAIRTTELPSNPSPLTFRNNQIQILQTSSTHATMAANVSQQVTNTHDTWLSHARTYNARQRDKSPDSPAKPTRTAKQTLLLLLRHKVWGGLLLPCMQRVVSVEVYVWGGVLKGTVTRLRFLFQAR